MVTSFCEITQDEKQGRYLKTTQNVPEGSLILKEEPLVIGPEGVGVVFCFCCNKILNGVKIPVCPKCKTASVCNENCEGIWHSDNECDFFSKCSVQCGHFLVNSQIILPLRCLVFRNSNNQKWDELLKLESHLEKRRKCPVWKDIAINIEALFLNLGIISKVDVENELIQKICGILDINSFELRTNAFIDNYSSGPVHVLRGLYLKAALINHDCVGNTHLAIDDNYNLIIHASIDIPVGASVYFNYSNPLKGNNERRLILRQSKYFDCLCNRCLDPSELKTEISSLRCPRCKHGFVRPVNVDGSYNMWSCNTCQRDFSHSLVQSTIIEARALLNSLNISDIAEHEELLHKLLKTFSPNHFLLLEIKQNLIGLYTQSEPKVNKLRRKIELCEELLPLFRVVEPGLSRMQGITLYELQSARVLLAEKRVKNKEIDEKAFIEVLKDADSLLKQSIKHLLYEPKCSPEGRLCLECLGELKRIRSLMTELELSPCCNEVKSHRKKVSF
ncbi:SET domain-containing protein SmydA-8-like isoform X2 [Agrilus planipennis]|uniref:SET domain-containing protein SmydA-8-like isoform X2 n=1 Tax=Agrilus planipennis TaxID=224129 RepID=A0A1W4WE07_AGRPL|nr:SET domain-containing protein SmydA-8-like isoform X2 [Agrilus planipennis]